MSLLISALVQIVLGIAEKFIPEWIAAWWKNRNKGPRGLSLSDLTPWAKWTVGALFALIVLALVMLITGCSHVPGFIKTPLATVKGVPDAGKPATMVSSESGEVLSLPKGTRLTVTKSEPLPAIPATDHNPAYAPQPAKEVTEIVLPEASEWRKTDTRVKADTGTVDTSIAAKRVDAAESRPLLYASLLSVVAGLVFFWFKYPTPAMICGGCAVVFFLAWKVSGLPPWFYAVGLLGLGVAGALCIGHEKGEQHAQDNANKGSGTQ